MATAVIMPRQGQTVESCILTEWYKEVGDRVSKGDLLFAYETDKASFEEEAPVDGILLARFFAEGEEVPVLENTALIGEEGESIEQYASGSGGGDEAEPKKPDVGIPATGKKDTATGHKDIATGDGDSEGVRISPRARKLAREKRVSIQSVTGSGPGGRIIERDILQQIRHGNRLTPLAKKKLEEEGLAVPGAGGAPHTRITSRDLVTPGTEGKEPARQAAGQDYTETPLSNFRKLVSEAMFRSLQNSAQLTHHLSANASKMLQIRKLVKERIKEGYPYNITLNDMVCYSVIRALKQHPDANAHFMGDRIRKFGKVNLGIAVDTERGLMVPALVDADDYSLPGLSAQLKTLAENARKGSVSPDLLSPEAASFTVSNLGNYGVEMFTPVINLPQVAILGVNTIIQRPALTEDGNFGFLPFIGLSLTYDHRALDGGPATLFLAAVKNEIESLSADLIV